jgi:single-strand DNA-binding protein
MATRTTTAPRNTTRNTQPVKSQPRNRDEFPKIDGAISGTLGANPEVRFTQSSRAVANLSVASTERVQDEDGNWTDGETTWHRVTVWGQMAEHVAETLQSGDRVVAVGYFQDREYENRDGEMTVTTDFTATEIGASLLFRDAEIKRVTRSRR